MKVLVNIITGNQITVIQETFPNFNGTFTITSGSITENFPPWQWVHVDDSFVVPDNRKPFVKDARVLLQILVRRFLREQGVHGVAQGIIEATDMYGWDASHKVFPQAIIDACPETEIPE